MLMKKEGIPWSRAIWIIEKARPLYLTGHIYAKEGPSESSSELKKDIKKLLTENSGQKST